MQNLPNKIFEHRYRCIGSIVFAAILLIVLYRWYSQALFVGMQQPPVFAEQTEYFYQFFYESQIAQWITGSPLRSLCADVLLLLLPAAFVISGRTLYAVGTFIVLLLYFFSYNLVTGHHYHGLVGALVVTIPFFTKNETKFLLLWQTARYYLLYIFVSAALWKMLRGTLFFPEQLSNILKAQQLTMLLQQPDSFSSGIVRCLIARPNVSHFLFSINVLIQLSFAIGFFTKKFDLMLLVLIILFCMANYFVMNIVSAELLVLGATLLNLDKCSAIFLRIAALGSGRPALKQP